MQKSDLNNLVLSNKIALYQLKGELLCIAINYDNTTL